MRIQNTVNKNIYDVTTQEWEVINNNGNAYKYKILDDGAPIEVKSMRASQVKLKEENLQVKITKKTKTK